MDIFTDGFMTLFNAVQVATEGEAAPSLMSNPTGFIQHYSNMVVEKSVFFVPKIIIALIILWIGSAIAGRVYRFLVKRTKESKNLDTTVGNFAATAAKYAVLIATFLAAIAVVGVPVAKVFVVLDMDKAIKIITQTASKDKRVLSEPDGPWARVSCLNDSSVDIQMRVWCTVDDYWDVRFDLIKAVKEAFDKGGVKDLVFPTH